VAAGGRFVTAAGADFCAVWRVAESERVRAGASALNARRGTALGCVRRPERPTVLCARVEGA